MNEKAVEKSGNKCCQAITKAEAQSKFKRALSIGTWGEVEINKVRGNEEDAAISRGRSLSVRMLIIGNQP